MISLLSRGQNVATQTEATKLSNCSISSTRIHPAPKMADQLLEKVRDVAEGQIDFEGQKLAELLSTVLLAVVGVGTIPS